MTLLTKATYAATITANLARNRFSPKERAAQAASRARGEELSAALGEPLPYAGPPEYAALTRRYRAGGLAPVDGRIPLIWWTLAENYGDLLSPWLARRMTGLPVVYAPPRTENCVAVGSIVNHARGDSVVWGSGLMGWENKWRIPQARRYAAVRGPVTRSVLRNIGYDVPRVYGDPALLSPLYFHPAVEKTHEVGMVVRWSERAWQGMDVAPDVRLINLHSGDVEGVTAQIMACRRIVSSSLHGLIVADAYGIPNAWLNSDASAGGSRPGGGEFKFYDYFASVDKLRHSQDLDARPGSRLSADYVLEQLRFSDEPITFDHAALLDACPFLERVDG